MRLVLASNNAKKLAELQVLFSPLGLELVNQGALGIPEAEEPHITFVENALLKARHAARHSGGAAISDDSGLCVDALDGAPGVVSANFASLENAAFSPGPTPSSPASGTGESMSSRALTREGLRALQDAANNRLLLERLQGIEDRRGRFVSTLVAVRSADDPEPLIAVGRWNGVLLTVQRGEGGFGYDPLMFIPILNQTVAELSAEVKNQRSHRAMASQQMLTLMREVWHLE